MEFYITHLRRRFCLWVKRCMRHCGMAEGSFLTICLLSLGTLAGLGLPQKSRKKAAVVLTGSFLLTALPLIGHFLRLWPKTQKYTG